MALLASAGCVAEGDSACGPNQVYEADTTLLEYAVCVCDEAGGYVFDEQQGYGCKQCPEGEMPVNGSCEAMESDAGTGDGSAGDSASPEPTGVGEPCESAADCAGFDAQYCDVFRTNSCMVDDCASGNNACGSGSVCCDFDALSAGFSICVSEDDLEGDACPMGGMRVEP